MRPWQACSALLERHGGHPPPEASACGRSGLTPLQEQLEALAAAWMEEQGGGRWWSPMCWCVLERIERPFWRTSSGS